MKYLYFLSNPFVSGSEWIYERISRFLLSLFSRLQRNGWQWAAQLPGAIQRGVARVLSDSRSCAQWLISVTGFEMPAGSETVGDRHWRQIKRNIALHRSDPMPVAIPGDCSTAGTTVRVSNLLQELELNPPKHLSPVRRRQRDKAIALVREEALLEAAYSFNNLRLDGIDEENRLRVGGEILPTPGQLPKKGQLTALGCCACTLGPRLEARVSQLFAEKRAALALALDFVGNELLLALGRRLQGDMLTRVRRQGLSLGQTLAIGDSEFDLSAKAAVLRLAEATEIGITLQRGNLLVPQKSTAVVFAVGRNLPKVCRSNFQHAPVLRELSDTLPV